MASHSWEPQTLSRDVALGAEQSALFFARAVHDLRQPIHAMALFLAQLPQTTAGSESQRLTARLSESLTAMEALLDRVLRISRLDGGMIPVEPVAVAVSALWQSLAGQFAESAQHQGVRLKFRPSPHYLKADAKLLSLILEAFIQNALTWSEQGTVLIACRVRGGKARLEVRDGGAGIAANLLPEVFQDFPSLPRPQPGKAMGLALARRVAQRLGCRLEVRSEPGRGAVFAVELPLSQPESLASARPVSQLIQAQPLAGRRVLLVAVSGEAGSVLSQMLANWGCVVTMADDAEAALAQIHAQGEAPELLLISIAAEGVAAAQAGIDCFRHEFGPDLPAAMLGRAEEQSIAREAGAHFLSLPPAPARVRALVQGLLTRR